MSPSSGRDVRTLPKAHLHLHFTGAMRHSTLLDLAQRYDVHLPGALRGGWPPELSATDERGWFRFQRLYDAARALLRSEEDVRRLLHEAAEDDAADGSRWLEIQVDPSGYATRFGGVTAFVELVLHAASDAGRAAGIGIAVVIAANRTKHPLDARTLARLAAQYAGRDVVGFGLSNDERRGDPVDFAPAFRIASRAGLISTPHAGELRGPDSVRSCLDALGATRLGHGVRGAEDPDLLKRLVDEDVTLEICPTSNVSLGVYPTAADVPLRALFESGASLALGADDPLLFGSGLADQYAVARDVHGFDDAGLAALARMSVHASAAPDLVRSQGLADIDRWLSPDPGN